MPGEFDRLVAEAMSAEIKGWEFDFLEGRVEYPRGSWDYDSLARTLLEPAEVALDHGTGGGEALAALGVVPPLLLATEAYKPNVSVAAPAVRRLPGALVHVDAGTHDSRGPDSASPNRRFPFRDCCLDVFLARHSAFAPREAFRLLRPGGHVLYQGGLVSARPRPGHIELRDYFDSDHDNNWGTWQVRQSVLDAGFEILDYREQLLVTKYRDIAGVIFDLRKTPWTVGEFRLEEHLGRLRELHDRIERDGYLPTAWTALLLLARKPSSSAR